MAGNVFDVLAVCTCIICCHCYGYRTCCGKHLEISKSADLCRQHWC